MNAALQAILDRANRGAGASTAPAAVAAARDGGLAGRQQQQQQQQQQEQQQPLPPPPIQPPPPQEEQQQQPELQTQQHDEQPAAHAEQAGGAVAGVGQAPAGGRLSLRERVAQHVGRQAGGGTATSGAAAAAATAAGAAAEPRLGDTAALGTLGPAATRPQRAVEVAAAVQAPQTAGGANPQVAAQRSLLRQRVQQQLSPPEQPLQQAHQAEQHQHRRHQRQTALQAGVVDLTLSSDDESDGAGACAGGRGTVAGLPSTTAGVEGESAAPASKRASRPWACPVCTLLNPPLALVCDACLLGRPAGWAS